MIASAAGLNTLAERERTRYLLRTAATEVMVVTYHGSCARSTIATIMAVSTAPLGNSHTLFPARRMSRSTRPENFLLRHAMRRRDASEKRRRIPVTARGQRATGLHHFRAFVHAALDEFADFFELRLVVDRAD